MNESLMQFAIFTLAVLLVVMTILASCLQARVETLNEQLDDLKRLQDFRRRNLEWDADLEPEVAHRATGTTDHLSATARHREHWQRQRP